jgi:hypothetical protein
MGYLRRNVDQTPSGGFPILSFVESDRYERKYEALSEFLGSQVWEDGGRRTPGTLMVFVDDGMIKAGLRDRDGGYIAFVSATTLDGLLDALESGIKTQSLEWRKEKADWKGNKKRS